MTGPRRTRGIPVREPVTADTRAVIADRAERHRAALAVAGRARDAADCRHLLDLLGLPTTQTPEEGDR